MKEDNENMVKTLKLITKDRERTNILRTVEQKPLLIWCSAYPRG